MGNEIQAKYPELPKDYWQNKTTDKQNSPLADINTDIALKDISIFKA